MYKTILIVAVAVALAISPVYAKSCGGASWYSLPGRTTASGQIMNPKSMTVAHKTLPFGTKIRVTSQTSGESVTLTVVDRGPFIKGRIIDVTKAAAEKLGFRHKGVDKVCISVEKT